MSTSLDSTLSFTLDADPEQGTPMEIEAARRLTQQDDEIEDQLGRSTMQLGQRTNQQHNAQRAAMLQPQHQQAMLNIGLPQQMANIIHQAIAALQVGNIRNYPINNLPPHLRHQFQ